MKLTDLKLGDTIRGFDGFGCIPAKATRVVQEDEDGLYIKCREGHHYLGGQEDENGTLVGLSLA